MANETPIIGTQLTAAPGGASVLPVVFDEATGRYHKGTTSSGGGSSTGAPAVVKNGDFSFEMTEDQVLEWMTFKKNAALNIKIGVTAGGGEIWSYEQYGAIDNPGPIDLGYYIIQDITIYVTGIAAGTIVKIKIS
jgi:hypothetical protein